MAEFLDKVANQYHPDIVVKKMIKTDLLSPKDKEYIEKVSEQYKNYTPLELEEYTHTLPEWKDPYGSSRKIRFADIMKALGKSDEEILAAKAEYEQFSALLSLKEY